MRGCRPYRLGPLYDDSDDPRGGIAMQFYSVEFAHKLHDKLEAFAFTDAGFLSGHRLQVGMPIVSVGFGTRVKIIESIPSLTVGLGFPINYQHKTQVRNFFFSIGGKF